MPSFKAIFLQLCFAIILSKADSDSSDYNDPNQGLPQGEIALYSSSHYYLIYSYVGNSEFNLTDSSFMYRMIPALYTSQSMFASNCTAFNAYIGFCQVFSCTNTSSISETLNFPYFSASGNATYLDISVDLSTKLHSPSILASNCTTGPRSSYGSGIFGMIGMGTAGMNVSNPPATAYFSIYLTTNFLNNRLYFYFNPNKTMFSTPSAVLQSDSNWQVSGLSTFQIWNETLNISNATLIFDINSPAIFLPQALYNFALNLMKKQFTCYATENDNLLGLSDNTDDTDDTDTNNTTVGNSTNNNSTNNTNSTTSDGSDVTDLSDTDLDTYDSSDTPFPICAYTYTNIHSLPILRITVGDQEIAIPPEIYVGQGSGQDMNITLNLITQNATALSEYYITPTYQDTIILGANFLKYYYTLFDARNGSNIISLYVANHNPIISESSNANTSTPVSSDTSSSSNSTVIILAVVCGILLVVCIAAILYFCATRKKDTIPEAMTRSVKEVGLVSLEAPIISGHNRHIVHSMMNTTTMSTDAEKSVL